MVRFESSHSSLQVILSSIGKASTAYFYVVGENFGKIVNLYAPLKDKVTLSTVL